MRRFGFSLLLAVAIALSAFSAASAAVTTKEIEEALTCQCGCGLTVHSCNHLQCGSGIPLKNEVLMLVNQGLSRDEILLQFSNRYGEKILSSPTTEGFNLTAWILPFVVIGLGAVMVLFVIRRWTFVGNAEPATGTPKLLISAEDRERLRAELAKGGQ